MMIAMRDKRASGFGHVIEYAADGKKTEMRQYVSTLNCMVATARDEMMATKERYNKLGGNTAYHMYQSFKPGEVTPDIAHEIGVKLAQELFGDRFEAVIATHLDKSHIHNHVVINSVSFKDGYKFLDSERFYRTLRRTSDRLCREYSLSVIENPKPGKSQNYAERQAECEGRPTWRGMIKAEVDEVIKMSMTEKEFLRNLRDRGFEIKTGAHFAVRPHGKPKFFRLDTNFGEDYTLAGINRQINRQTAPVLPTRVPERERTVRHIPLRGSLQTVKKITGFRALYIRYMYLLGKLPHGRPPINPNRIFFLYREDLRKLDRYAKEIKLLAVNRIDTSEQLFSYKAKLTEQIEPLKEERTKLYNKLRREKDEPKREEIKAQIKILSTRIGTLQKEVGLCDGIAAHTKEMKEKMAKHRECLSAEEKAVIKRDLKREDENGGSPRQFNNKQREEQKAYEQFRGRG